MSDVAIRVEHLGKQYRLGGQQQRYATFREALVNAGQASLGWLKGERKPDKNLFWALEDVSFEVKQGEAVGIIGRNGAGKSTLLKILSRITSPTRGRVDLYGRVGSLLEVGTGFHPELSGRENIYLNGAILGMTRKEIQRKFDEIVDFAEIEKFLDTAVKFYSSGMYVRLAFAVAAHLEPEILVVDEVLAVGDAEFQKKCLGKMGDVAGEGRTVLFVSHNMAAIKQLCRRALLVQNGILLEDGITQNVIKSYINLSVNTKTSTDALIRDIPPDPVFHLDSVSIYQSGEQINSTVVNGDPFEIEINYKVFIRTTGLRVLFDLYDRDEVLLFRSFHDEQADGIPIMEIGEYTSKATIPADLLAPTCYDIRIYATIYNVRYCTPVSGVTIPINVIRTGKANRAYLDEPIRGKLSPAIVWETFTNISNINS